MSVLSAITVINDPPLCVCVHACWWLCSASKAASRKRSSRSSKSSRQVSAKEPVTSLSSEEPSLKVDSVLSDADAQGDVDVTLKAVGSSVDMELTTKGAIHAPMDVCICVDV